MKIDPVHYYYKDLKTGMEMEFSKLKISELENYGWSVGFPKASFDEIMDYEGEIPWPSLTPEEQAIVDENYEKLYKALEEEEE